ncbi:MAG TPA: FAD-dependent oxidoreductase, partial [Jiangellales bacterium]|nr:FAD-dependent oxidoreductase [Jiangellales bacterium]
VVPVLRARHPGLADRCEGELARLGVEVRTGVRLSGVTRDGAMLSDGTWLPAATVLAATGQRPVVVAGLDSLPRDGRGRLVASPDLRVADGVWAAGDAARVGHPRTGEPVPANALWAMKAGAHAGRNVARSLRGRRTRPFRYLGLGQAAAFGVGRSVAVLYGVPLSGWTAWLLRLGFFLRFMPSRRNAVGVLTALSATVRGRRTAGVGTVAPSVVRAVEPAALQRAA